MVNQISLFGEAPVRHYYVTTPLAPQEAAQAEREAISQEERIYAYLKETGIELTGWALKEVFPTFEITSIRRGLFNLEKKEGKITQTGWVQGPKGKPVGKFKAI